jgi:hypothetical protein
MQDLSLKSMIILYKRFRSTHKEANKIDFTFVWFFYDFIWIFQDLVKATKD